MANSVVSRIYDVAEGQDGYFSTFQATEVGIRAPALARALVGGSLIRTSRGVYRLSRYPELYDDTHYWEAILWPQARSHVRGTLSHYTALKLHGLSTANPGRTHITIPRSLRIRREIPQMLAVHRADLADHEVQYAGGFPATTVERTLRDIAALGDTVVLRDALRDARARDLAVPVELRDA